MKKTALALKLILALFVSLMVGVEFVKVVEANPYWIFERVDPVPGTIPPTITIASPQNNTGYSSDKITVSFNISKPQLAGWASSIIVVEYSLDNETVQPFSIWNQVNANGIPAFDTTFNSPSLTIGNHSLTVKADGIVYRTDPLEKFFINSTSTIFFTTGVQPTPTATPKPEPFPTTLSIASVSLVAVVVLGLFVYFKKRKH